MAQTCYQRKIRRNGPSIWVCLVNISSCQFVTCHKFAAANCLHGCCLHNHSCWSSSCPMLVHCAQTAQQITAQKPGVPPSSSVCHPADTAADPHIMLPCPDRLSWGCHPLLVCVTSLKLLLTLPAVICLAQTAPPS